ncbi:Ribonuclease H-like domain,Protein of unknown function DUF1759,Peptidase aspartic [Cinara cedri]|uniref:Integrase catalytic domain-containing protein n=1 Tax=Cinara cedri TaxID=506608 RepID=A0A5E4NSA6_9HEMI|nr:Ribonuclease H-like domain,Protein of unknown function DUF1759,Peptidase aspartic [Cinara cedri]
MSENKNTEEWGCLELAKKNAGLERDDIESRIRAIHSLSLRVLSDSAEISRFLVAAESLDRLEAQFKAKNDFIINCLVALDEKEDYSRELVTEISELINASKAVAKTLFKPISGTPNAEHLNVTQPSCSWKIPLPSYGGDLSGWPVFRDRYVSLVVNRLDLSNTERYYNLIDCLTGEAFDAIKNIPISEATYELAWSILVERFDKPLQLATIIVDKLMSAPMHSQESLDGLKDFLVLFSDQVSVLKSLNIPSLSEFLLFAISLRCLPLTTRKAFEAVNKNKFPSIANIVSYIKARVAFLETADSSSISKCPIPASDKSKPVFVTMLENKNTEENEWLKLVKKNAGLKRDDIESRIRAIHSLSLRVLSDTAEISRFLVAVESLDRLEAQFKAQNDLIIDCLVALDEKEGYSRELVTEISELIDASKAVAKTLFKPISGTPNAEHLDVTQPSCSWKIPLPSYGGDLSGWPVFRDRYVSLVVNRLDLSNTERYYNLIGCLTGEAFDAIKNIPVSEAAYELAWSILVERFDKPLQLATIIVDKLMSAPMHSQESLDGLKDFLVLFSDQVSVLKSLNIPSLSEFLLFAIFLRCLPLTTRKAYEAVNKNEFPSIANIVSYIKARVAFLEAADYSSISKCPTLASDQSKPVSQFGAKAMNVSLISTKSVSSVSLKRLFCEENDTPISCHKLTKFSSNKKYKTAWKNNICFARLSTSSDSVMEIASTSSAPASSLKNLTNTTTVLLGTVLVQVRDRSGRMRSVRALLDPGSQISALTTSCVVRLGLKPKKWTAPLVGLSGVLIPTVSDVVDCFVTSRYSNDSSIDLHAWVMPKLTADMSSQNLPTSVRSKFSHLVLADPYFDCSTPIDMLLGADVIPSILNGEHVLVDESLPPAYKSIFGWILIDIGKVKEHQSLPSMSLTVSLEGLVQRFWQLEEPEDAPVTFTDDDQCESIYVKERCRDITGRFMVPLPFIPQRRSEKFPESRHTAIRQFQNLERKFQNDENLYTAYKNFMEEYESLGHMSVATEPGLYFIPHHPGFKYNCSSNKIRVIFDASNKLASQISLNQCLYAGPKLQLDIVDILTRFRIHQFVFTIDLYKMYRQILVLPAYCRYQHIFWRSSPAEELKEYQLNTVTYGVNSAPFLALRVLKDIAEYECEKFPAVRDSLLQQTNVDDICIGADSEEELMELKSDLCATFMRAGLDLKMCSSNSQSMLEAEPSEDRASENISFNDGISEVVKILELQWDPSSDIFKFNVRPIPSGATKRAVFSTVARIFDPLGLLAPMIFYAKFIMHQIWKAKLTWDEPLPPKLKQSWETFTADWPVLSTLRISRHVSTQFRSRVELCGFCDATKHGYASVLYLRTTSPDGVASVFLLGAKTKMVSKKITTIPRLELCAAVLLARWMARMLKILSGKLEVTNIFAWTSSKIVLSWLMNMHTVFNIFVTNRIHQVRQLIPSCHWYYVQSSENPADCASRGILPSELIVHPLYWTGPTFLKGATKSWDVSVPTFSAKRLPEIQLMSTDQEMLEVEWISQFSSYRNMIRVVAWIRRFISRCRKQTYPHNFLSRDEIDESLKVIVLASQRYWFPGFPVKPSRGDNSNYPSANIHPFIDHENIIRIGNNYRVFDTFDPKLHPMILSKNSHLSLLITRHWHWATRHSGLRVITPLIQSQFWITSLRSVIRKVIGKCITCLRAIALSLQPVDFPILRDYGCRPFTRVGVDYAGPMLMRERRLREVLHYKIYVAVFICMTTKAVHLEVVSELSMNAFLSAFSRFADRRGFPSDVYSDCGTNFKGAAKHLSIVINDPANHNTISSYFSCRWHFNPPEASHFGDLWEAAIHSFKKLLVRIIGDHRLMSEEMTTILCKIEAILNSRPLTPMTTSSLDLNYLTPGHFLSAEESFLNERDALVSENIHVLTDKAINYKAINRLNLLNHCHQSFWRQWSTEYLFLLQTRAKRRTNASSIKVGNMVVVKDIKTPPALWCLGRIVEVTPGSDGVVQGAKILTSNGVLTRPIVKLVLLPMDTVVTPDQAQDLVVFISCKYSSEMTE